MAELMLFHHALGLTDGVRSLAETFRRAGHTVHTPELFEGKTFSVVEDGVAHAREIGFDTVLERGVGAAEGLPDELVYAGISLGVMPAQQLAQNRPGAKGAVFISAAMPVSEFGGPWPSGLPLQIHLKESDPWVIDEDLSAARELADTIETAELFLYPGDQHLFADDSTADHDKMATSMLTQRISGLLDRIA
jgi:dienelactone hydrolase